MTKARVREIASEPSFIEAQLWSHSTVINALLEVLTSPVVEETDDCYSPVIDFLSEHCSREIDWDRFDNPDFFFGESIRTEYRVFATCPGDAVEHNCQHARKERVGIEEAK